MTQTASTRNWDGWELWYFGSDYLSSVDVPAEHWRVASARPPEPPLRVVERPHADTGEHTHHACACSAADTLQAATAGRHPLAA